MMRPISNDIREKIMAEVKLGQRPVAQIAESYGVKPNTVYGWGFQRSNKIIRHNGNPQASEKNTGAIRDYRKTNGRTGKA